MKKSNFLARPEPLVNDILSPKTSGSGDENGTHTKYTPVRELSGQLDVM